MALWGYDANDPSLNHATGGASTNPLGHFGASFADVAQQTLGLAAWLLVLVLPLWALRLILGRPLAWPWLPVAALPLALLASAAWLATRPLPDSWPFWVGLGGFVGDFMLHRLERPIGPELYPTVTGSIALLLAILAIGLSLRELWHGGRALALAPWRARPPAAAPARRRPSRAGPRRSSERYGEPPQPRAAPAPARRGARACSAGCSAACAAPRARRERAVDLAPADIKRTIDPAIAAASRRRRPGAAAADDAGAAPWPSRRRGRRRPPRRAPPEPAELVAEVGFKLPPLDFLTAPRQRSGVSLDRAVLERDRPRAREGAGRLRRARRDRRRAARARSSPSTSSSRRPARARRAWWRSPTTSPARSARCRCASRPCRAAT